MTSPLDYRMSYRRNLPHIQPPGATFFVTFRLRDSLPAAKIHELAQERASRLAQIPTDSSPDFLRLRQYDEEKRYFGRVDALLDKVEYGSAWLRDPRIASVVRDSLHARDGTHYELIAYCIMPNHVHAVLTPLEEQPDVYYPLGRIMHDLKGYTARLGNVVLGRKGKFWQAETYDHIVRDSKEGDRIVAYVLNNPVKAGLAEEWQAWPWSYWKYAED